MSRVIEKRQKLLGLMRDKTLDKGFFTVTDIAGDSGVPRSTAQDWITRFLEEGCVIVREEQKGRQPAHYVAASTLPKTACRRIFTTVDEDCVEIYHVCMSAGCASYCEFHHSGSGILKHVMREGTTLRERAYFGRMNIEVGPYPKPAVAVTGISKEGSRIVQHIRSFGGPAYSLTDMMSHARGVIEVRVKKNGLYVEGDIVTEALDYYLIGIDDTDSGAQGATFAVALALLQHLAKMKGVIPIGHRVVMLNPDITEKTAGNSCSYVEIAAPPGSTERVHDTVIRFVGDETRSEEWGVAVKKGFLIGNELRNYGMQSRMEKLSEADADRMAAENDIMLFGGRGRIGALAAVSLANLPIEYLLDPRKKSRSH